MDEISNSVIIASAGRPAQLDSAIAHLLATVGGVGQIVVCVPDQASFVEGSRRPSVEMLIGPRGAAAQRNHALDHLPDDTEHVFFFDDDCVPHSDYVLNGAAAFRADPTLAGITGTVLIDGAGGDEVPMTDALAALRQPVKSGARRRPAYSLYGCNFAVRRDLLVTHRFDERLPLYSWLEDEDLSRRLAGKGGLEVVAECVCVHLGAESGGRTRHTRFGYSQVTNPVYLWKKGSITPSRALRLILRPVSANVFGLLGSSRTSRRARLLGNMMSVRDLARGRVTPERISTL